MGKLMGGGKRSAQRGGAERRAGVPAPRRDSARQDGGAQRGGGERKAGSRQAVCGESGRGARRPPSAGSQS